ncbi:hypothetical protein K438DRAFT_1758980 [Mycena galopus ATCC 62051]|nr:hypothetical protein K438DRAFT_1758980 [Mycena galopus ATCC 62051]
MAFYFVPAFESMRTALGKDLQTRDENKGDERKETTCTVEKHNVASRQAVISIGNPGSTLEIRKTWTLERHSYSTIPNAHTSAPDEHRLTRRVTGPGHGEATASSSARKFCRGQLHVKPLGNAEVDDKQTVAVHDGREQMKNDAYELYAEAEGCRVGRDSGISQ